MESEEHLTERNWGVRVLNLRWWDEGSAWEMRREGVLEEKSAAAADGLEDVVMAVSKEKKRSNFFGEYII